MVRIDFERKKYESAVDNAQDELNKAKFHLFYYDNREKFYKSGVEEGVDYLFFSLDDILVAKKSLERCAIDSGELKRVSPIVGGSDVEDMAKYRCKKCHLEYLMPLTERDKKKRDKESQSFGKIMVK